MLEKFLKLKTKKHSNKGFTLIELLVVVAIIGILSSVVLASLNSAREKSKIALIKSTLKQLYSQAQINFTEYGSFINSNSSLNCTGPGNNLGKIVQPLIDQGIIVKCYNFYGTGSGGIYTGDDYLRLGATALIYNSSELKAWSVDENGVAKWDTKGVDSSGSFVVPDISAPLINAKNYCALSGGRLPSMEEFRSLYYAYYQGAGATATPFVPNGFQPGAYWSSTALLSDSSYYYAQNMTNSYISGTSQGSSLYIRCIR